MKCDTSTYEHLVILYWDLLVLLPVNMAPKQTPPFRAEHVSSLLRTDYLLEAREKFNKKELTSEQLREVEDKAVEEAVKLQREVGIKGITDGEYRCVSSNIATPRTDIA